MLKRFTSFKNGSIFSIGTLWTHLASASIYLEQKCEGCINFLNRSIHNGKRRSVIYKGLYTFSNRAVMLKNTPGLSISFSENCITNAGKLVSHRYLHNTSKMKLEWAESVCWLPWDGVIVFVAVHVYDFSSDWLTLWRLRLCPLTLFDHS